MRISRDRPVGARSLAVALLLSGCLFPFGGVEEPDPPFLGIDGVTIIFEENTTTVQVGFLNILNETLLGDGSLTFLVSFREVVTVYPGRPIRDRDGSIREATVQDMGPGAEVGPGTSELMIVKVFGDAGGDLDGNRSILVYSRPAERRLGFSFEELQNASNVFYVPPVLPGGVLEISIVHAPVNRHPTTSEKTYTPYRGNVGMYYVWFEMMRIDASGVRAEQEFFTGCFNWDTPMYYGFRDDGPDCPVYNAFGDFTTDAAGGPQPYPAGYQLNWTV